MKFLILQPRMMQAGNPFAFTVKTTGVDETFSLPLEATGTYDFHVDWGDLSSDDITVWNDAAATHTYADAGTYEIQITGSIVGWRFNDGGDKLKIYEIKSWGPLRLGNNHSYFYGCSNLTITATDILDLTGTTTFLRIFRGCSSLTTIPSINGWDVSSITDMTYAFVDCSSFNQDLSSWDTSSVTSMYFMFFDCLAFDQNMSSWDITSVTNMDGMFSGVIGVTLSTPNYDALLVGWEAQVEQPNVIFHAGNSKYTGGGAAAAARAALVANGWTITDGGIA